MFVWAQPQQHIFNEELGRRRFFFIGQSLFGLSQSHHPAEMTGQNRGDQWAFQVGLAAFFNSVCYILPGFQHRSNKSPLKEPPQGIRTLSMTWRLAQLIAFLSDLLTWHGLPRFCFASCRVLLGVLTLSKQLGFPKANLVHG